VVVRRGPGNWNIKRGKMVVRVLKLLNTGVVVAKTTYKGHGLD